MSATYIYSQRDSLRASQVLSLLDDLLFQKKAEMQEYKDIEKYVQTFEQQLRVIKDRLFEFETFSNSYLQEDALSFEESLFLLLGLNPDVLANKYFHSFNLISCSANDYLAIFLTKRTDEGKQLYKYCFNTKELLKTSKYIQWAIKKGYLTKSLLKPKTANHRAAVKQRNFEITLEGLILILSERKSKTPITASAISAQLHKSIEKKLIAINVQGDKPKPDTLRRYIGEIIKGKDWKLQPESIRKKIILPSE